MTLVERLAEYIRACFTGLWITSQEQDDALLEIAQLCRGQEWQQATWDIDRGFLMSGGDAAETRSSTTDPLAAIRAAAALGTAENPTLIVFKNFHRFLASAELVQALRTRSRLANSGGSSIWCWLRSCRFLWNWKSCLSYSSTSCPREQLLDIARGIATETGELPEGSDLERVLEAASGLTRYEAEGAFSLALVRHQRIEPQTIWELKSQTLLKNGLLSLYRGGQTFADLGGLESLKAFCLRALRPHLNGSGHCRPRGVLALGIAGTGKSRFCKALGNETGRPTLILDVGSLMGSLVGQTRSAPARRYASSIACSRSS